MGTVGLDDGSVELYGGECWVTLWGVGLHGRVLDYMVVIVGLHGGSVGLHCGMLNYMVGCGVTW